MGSDPYEKELFDRDNLKNINHNHDDKIQLGIGELSEYKFRYYEKDC